MQSIARKHKSSVQSNSFSQNGGLIISLSDYIRDYPESENWVPEDINVYLDDGDEEQKVRGLFGSGFPEPKRPRTLETF